MDTLEIENKLHKICRNIEHVQDLSEERDQLIYLLYEDGRNDSFLAHLTGLSRQRIHQILNKVRLNKTL